MVDLVEKVIYRITTPTRQSSGVVFLCLKHYLINVNTNVSNARMNIPKAIRSLKSNGFLSISTTPILCRIEVGHPATRLFLSIYYHIGIINTTNISAAHRKPLRFACPCLEEPPDTCMRDRSRRNVFFIVMSVAIARSTGFKRPLRLFLDRINLSDSNS